MRKYPLFPIVLHRCTNGIKIPGTGVIIEKGTLVGIPVLEYHRDTRYYSDPETFDPDRFSPVEVRKRIPNAFIPFGDGPETCFGEYEFLLVHTNKSFTSILWHKI